MSSINQTSEAIRLPNFCNRGVLLRALLAPNVLVLAAAVALARRQGAVVAGVSVLIELSFLQGRARLPADIEVFAAIAY